LKTFPFQKLFELISAEDRRGPPERESPLKKGE
jgi:hypothetical protein